MHRLCKDIDITDYKTILPWVEDCIIRHWKRHDFQHFLFENGLNKDDFSKFAKTHKARYLREAVIHIAKKAAQGIYEGCLDLDPPVIKRKFDIASGKMRDIGCECPMQQVYDFIAVNAAMPVFNKRMVPQQASSVEGRGQVYGMRMIRKWAMKNNAAVEYAERHGYYHINLMRFFVKLDVTQCFPSCRLETFMEYFCKDCGNEDLIWLWWVLLLTHRIDDNHLGFIIGSLISQWGAQYMISFAYHYVMNFHKKLKRSDKIEQVASHMIIFMDDMLITAPSRSDLLDLVRNLIEYMQNNFGLTIKTNYAIQEFSDSNGIDMMGYVVYPSGKVEIRPRDWIKIRRMLLRSNSQGYRVSYKQAKRLTSYKGYIIHSNSERAKDIYKTPHVFRSASKVVSNKERMKRNGQNLLPRNAEEDPIYASSVRPC